MLDLAAISLSVASYIAAAAKFLTPHSSHPLKTQYLLASFRKFRLQNKVHLDLRSCYVVRCVQTFV